jgi:alpha-tubulin suppressor-like RCC1 family protein
MEVNIRMKRVWLRISMILLLMMCLIFFLACCADQNKALKNDTGETISPDEQENLERDESIDSSVAEILSEAELFDCKIVTTSFRHSLAIRTDSSLWVWGDNEDGQLGDGTRTYWDNGHEINNDKQSPVKIMDDVTDAAAGAFHSLAIKADRSLWAWGRNAVGQIGDGTITTFDETEYPPWNWSVLEDNSKLKPVKIMEDVVSVAAGNNHSLAIKTDGSLWAWGANRNGQLGDGTTEDKVIPIKIMDDVAIIAAGGDQSFAIKADGSLWTWGWISGVGQLSDGTIAYESIPVKI